MFCSRWSWLLLDQVLLWGIVCRCSVVENMPEQQLDVIVFDAQTAEEAQYVVGSQRAKPGLQPIKDLFKEVGEILVLAFHAECAQGSFLKEACVDGMASVFFVALSCKLQNQPYKIMFWDPNYTGDEKERCFKLANWWSTGNKAYVMMGDCCAICDSPEDTAQLYSSLGKSVCCIPFDHHVSNLDKLKAHIKQKPPQNVSFKYIQTTLSCKGNPTTYDAFLMLDMLGGIQPSLREEMRTIALLASLSDACVVKPDLIEEYMNDLKEMGYKRKNIMLALHHQDFVVQQSSDCMIDKWMDLMKENDLEKRNNMAEVFQTEMQHYLSLEENNLTSSSKTLRQKYAEVINVMKGEMQPTIKKKKPHTMKEMLDECLPAKVFYYRDGEVSLKFVFLPEGAAEWGRPAALLASDLCAEYGLAGIFFAQRNVWSLRVDLKRFKHQGKTALDIGQMVRDSLIKQHYGLSTTSSLDKVEVGGHAGACVLGPLASRDKLIFGWNEKLCFTDALQLSEYFANTPSVVVTKTSDSEERLEEQRVPGVLKRKRSAGVLKKPSTKVHMFSLLVVVFLIAQ